LVDGYPKFETKGSKEITTFRFKKFSKNIIYDPIVEPTQPAGDSAASTAKLSMVVALFAVLAKLLA